MAKEIAEQTGLALVIDAAIWPLGRVSIRGAATQPKKRCLTNGQILADGVCVGCGIWLWKLIPSEGGVRVARPSRLVL
jgi:hypothetical protein